MQNSSPPRTRQLVFAAADLVFGASREQFVTLLPAYSVDERVAMVALVGTLAGIGCIEFCCIGPQCESLHDAVDCVVEDMGLLDVVTTWDFDETEGLEYFVDVAGGQSAVLMALVSRHARLVAQLQDLATSRGIVVARFVENA